MTEHEIDARLGALLGGAEAQPDPRFAAHLAMLVRAEAVAGRARRAAWRRFAGEGLCALAVGAGALVVSTIPAASAASGGTVPTALAALLLCWLFLSGQCDEQTGCFTKAA